MHQSVMDFLKGKLGPAEIAGKSVLEVGSFNVNGSPRAVVEPLGPAKYVGVDAARGPDVDVVCDAGNVAVLFGQESFDVVISTEMLEHAREWKMAVYAMKRALRQDGLLVVTTRGPGFPYHGFPHDYWRFTKWDFARIFKDLQVLVLEDDPDPKSPGVLLKARKPVGWVEEDLGAIEVEKAPSPAGI